MGSGAFWAIWRILHFRAFLQECILCELKGPHGSWGIANLASRLTRTCLPRLLHHPRRSRVPAASQTRWHRQLLRGRRRRRSRWRRWPARGLRFAWQHGFDFALALACAGFLFHSCIILQLYLARAKSHHCPRSFPGPPPPPPRTPAFSTPHLSTPCTFTWHTYSYTQCVCLQTTALAVKMPLKSIPPLTSPAGLTTPSQHNLSRCMYILSKRPTFHQHP